MENQKVVYEIKFQKSVIVIFGIIAFVMSANLLTPVFKATEAVASSGSPAKGLCNQRCVDVVSTSNGDALLVKIAQ
ncbi:hypothetical protein N9Y31_07000 [Alphaproteobacteria bacterium]|nr:hypothetical protein [Alphaproteobacteria bacterium]